MPQVTTEELEKLTPYIAGERPDQRGEVDMFCPMHNDTKRSASLNIRNGVWFCHAGCGGGSVRMLVDNEDSWVSAEGRVTAAARPSRPTNGHLSAENVTDGLVQGWHQALLANTDRLEDLKDARGILLQTVKDYEIGYDLAKKVYTIPVRGPRGKLWNVRRYDMAPANDRRKIWGIRGMNSPRLYPYKVVDLLSPGDPVIICGGEWDSLITLQNGFTCVTRTGAEKIWKSAWSKKFRGCTVYLCHDCDRTGMEANAKVFLSLKDVAEEIRFLRLPYPIAPKRGKDLTDFFLDNEENGPSELQARIEDAPLWDPERHQPTDLDPSDASVIDSFDSRRVGEPLRLTVTIKGKRDPGYSVPRRIEFNCTRDAGSKCQVCPLNEAGGFDAREVDPGDPLILDMIDNSRSHMQDAIREWRDLPKCNRLKIHSDSHQAVEVLFARPSVDHVRSEDAADYKNMKLLSVGRHDTLPNNTVQITGALHPNPKSQNNEFLSWDVQKQETSLDHFDVDGESIQAMRRFQAEEGERPIKKLGIIARSLAQHVTKIYGRPEMHAAIDLVYHSVLAFDFAGQRIDRGWLELLIAGDTRTGKSEAAQQLARHYGAGEVISCESATFAGIVGGLQQYGASKEWAVTWGAIPINDRRLVVLDEVGGLHTDEIARMSSVRSSGTAELTKIQSERTFARTRLIWLANPRNATMSDFTYGVQAIRPLIGNDEDVARFDLAMTLVKNEVPSDVINKYHKAGRAIYHAEACGMLVRWAWSRKPEQIIWTPGAEEAVLRCAQELGEQYTEDPPLVQAANIRVKLARLAVALAARLFSTDDTYENVLVRPEHVLDVVSFLDRCYSMRGFGYAEMSNERIKDDLTARDSALWAERYLEENEGLAKFLRSTGRFRRPDIEEVLNVSREEANGIINQLWRRRMIRKDRSDIRVEPTLHQILRTAK